ncbi:MAG: DNA alkylation repair protein [Planctomycetes bacterium]|nr:DNA alkylation repair protein [Planctomycetota bacterium]
MAEPFKNLIGPELIRVTARHLARVYRPFPERRFVTKAIAGLDALELKARVAHVAAALADALPQDFAAAAAVLEASLRPARLDDDLSVHEPAADGLAGWAIWPMTEWVVLRGMAHPERALAALHAMTQRNTAEYAIRPFLIEHEALTMRTLHEWLDDPSPHVRRLVSEGSRPRLPWGVQLTRLVADPTPTLPLLERLQDDASEYVRRSVANHLNDIAKDHPHVVVAWVERFLPGAGRERTRLLRHASRTLIKRADRAALAAWGLAKPLRGVATLRVTPKRASVGGDVRLVVELRSTAKQPQPLVVDYVVHHPKADGRARPKTWKGWKLTLAPGETHQLEKRHSLRPVTTRRDHPGRHDVELLVNGAVVARAAFDLRA